MPSKTKLLLRAVSQHEARTAARRVTGDRQGIGTCAAVRGHAHSLLLISTQCDALNEDRP